MPTSKNPVQIQEGGSNGKSGLLPLVLIHDGGGTTFSYHCLGHLGRDVYGIYNPRFYSGRPWTMGIEQMCKLYAKLIQFVVPCGKLILGGWSFGGILSLELAKELAELDFEVAGIVMIDSVYPKALQNDGFRNICSTPAAIDTIRPEMRLLVGRCIAQADELLRAWDMPRFAPRKASHQWDNRDAGMDAGTASTSSGHSSSRTESPGTLYRASSMTDDSDDSESQTAYISKPTILDAVNLSLLPIPPLIVLLRCEEYVPMEPSEERVVVCQIDATRGMQHLGWEDYGSPLISKVKTIPGHHFSIFLSEHINETTREISDACRWLERKTLEMVS